MKGVNSRSRVTLQRNKNRSSKTPTSQRTFRCWCCAGFVASGGCPRCVLQRLTAPLKLVLRRTYCGQEESCQEGWQEKGRQEEIGPARQDDRDSFFAGRLVRPNSVTLRCYSKQRERAAWASSALGGSSFFLSRLSAPSLTAAERSTAFA